MGHVEDRWYRTVTDETTGKERRERTLLYGKGMRYRVRFYNAEGKERSKSFPDRQKEAAKDFLIEMESQRLRGSFLDPVAGRIAFKPYALGWLDRQTFDESTREITERRLRNHIFPHIGGEELLALLPAHMRQLDRKLQLAGLSDGYRLVVFGTVSTILNAAVDDKRLARNPCKARSAKPPKPQTARVTPWSAATVVEIRRRMEPRYRITVDLGTGCGLRQGESLAFSEDDIDFITKNIRVERQLKIVGSRLVFALPKGRKTREVPLPDSVADRLKRHIAEFPPVAVTLPWGSPKGKPATVRLLVHGLTDVALDRNYFNEKFWWPAVTAAGVPRQRKNGMHALRHFFASTLLDAGESIKALASYLGHSDPGFTLRTYTHLMPSSAGRTRRAIDQVLGGESSAPGRGDTSRRIPTARRRPRRRWRVQRRSSTA